jgi:hypothetical protein
MLPLSIAPLMVPPDSTSSVPPPRTIHPLLGDPAETDEVSPLLTVVMTTSPGCEKASEVLRLQDGHPAA